MKVWRLEFEVDLFDNLEPVNCLASLIQDYVEFLPLESEEGDFYAINITGIF